MQVDKHPVEMYQLFKDFDRSKAYTRIVTPTQFGRILTTLKICVNPEDLRLLCRKFADAATGDINYPAFVQCVDKVFVNYTVDRLKEYDCLPACPKVATAVVFLDTISSFSIVGQLTPASHFYYAAILQAALRVLPAGPSVSLSVFLFL